MVLGLVTTKRPELESKDDLRRRITRRPSTCRWSRDEAAKYVPRSRSACPISAAFPPPWQGNALTYDQQVAKLRLIVNTVQEVWG